MDQRQAEQYGATHCGRDLLRAVRAGATANAETAADPGASREGRSAERGPSRGSRLAGPVEVSLDGNCQRDRRLRHFLALQARGPSGLRWNLLVTVVAGALVLVPATAVVPLSFLVATLMIARS